jgi:hypothetical protein
VAGVTMKSDSQRYGVSVLFPAIKRVFVPYAYSPTKCMHQRFTFSDVGLKLYDLMYVKRE